MIGNQASLLKWLAAKVSKADVQPSLVHKILLFFFNLSLSAVAPADGAVARANLDDTHQYVPSARRMGLCSLAALENIALNVGIDPYQFKKEGLIEALLRARHPPVPSIAFETPGLIDGLLAVLAAERADAE
jgi:hypothetical protein